MDTHARRFEGWHTVVTGAGTGIGRAIALRLAREGAQLSLLARDAAKLATTARTIRESGGADASVFALDIRDEALVLKRFGEAGARHGPIRALVANSRIGGAHPPRGRRGAVARPGAA